METTRKPTCEKCSYLVREIRTDYHPTGEHFHCRKAGAWIGFSNVTPNWCPFIQEEIEAAKEQ